jgi:hypothetical protein
MAKQRTEFNFIGGSYNVRSKFVDTQECINLYPEAELPSSKSITCLIGTPGLKSFSNIPIGSIRGLYCTSLNRLFTVCGSGLYEIDIGGNATNLGTLITSDGIVGMVDNGNQLLIVDGFAAYTFDLTNWTSDPQYGIVTPYQDPSVSTIFDRTTMKWNGQTWDGTALDVLTPNIHGAGTFALLGQITICAMPTISTPQPDLFVYNTAIVNPTHCIFKDGYFVINSSGSGRFYISTLATNVGDDNITFGSYEGGLFDPLQYATAEGSPDNLSSIVKTNNELILVGDKSTEIWYNSGAAPFPFQRIQSAFFDIGTVAPYSVVANGNDVFWLGANSQGQGMVMHANGYVPQRISTHSIEYMIGQLNKVNDAVGWTYQQEGHFFYVLTFPSGNRTFVFDITTGLWHERGYWNSYTGANDRHRGVCVSNFNQLVYVGDWENGNIYQLDLNTYTDDGNTIRRIRTCPHIHYQMKRMYYNELEIDMIKGAGLSGIGEGTNPQAMLQWSNDAGFTWSSERWEPIGAIGQYKQRVHWHGLGMTRDRVFRFVITDPVSVIIINAFLYVEVEDD